MESRIFGNGPTAGKRPPGPGDGWTPLANPTIARGKKMLESSLIEHPAVGIGAALMAGVLLGWLIKRR